MSADASTPSTPADMLKMVVTLTIEGSGKDVWRSHDALIRFVEQEETVREDDFNISLDWHSARATSLPANETPPNQVRNATDSGELVKYGIRKCRDSHWHVTIGGLDDLATKPDALTYERALKIANRLNAGEELADIESAASPSSLPSNVKEAIEEFKAAAIGEYVAIKYMQGGNYDPGSSMVRIAAAQSSLESLFLKQQQEIERLQIRSDEGYRAHSASFGALMDVALLVNMNGVDDYSEVPKTVEAALESLKKEQLKND